MISKEIIEEYKKLYKSRFGVELSDKEASLRASNLLGLYRTIYNSSLIKNTKYD